MAALAVGAKAPAFTLTDQKGTTVELADYRGKRVVVYFYPKASTPGCTTQSCSLRDSMAELKKLMAVVVGISPDSPERQRRFDEANGLGFTLLADQDHAVADTWGTWGERSMYGKKYMGIIRLAFVIDEQGTIAAAFYKVSPKDTVPKVLAALAG